MIIDDTTNTPQYEFETFYKILNLDDTIYEHMPNIKQSFIEYYGEENKDYIDKKFDSLIFFGYFDPGNFKFDPRSFGELTNKILNKLNLKDSNDTFYSRKIFGMDGIVDGAVIDVVKYFNGNIEYRYNTIRLLQKFYPEVTIDNVDILNQQGRFVEFHEWILENQEYIDFYIDMCNLRKSSKELRYKLEREYFFKLIEEYNEYLPSSVNIPIKDELLNVLEQNDFSEYFDMDPWYWILFGKNLTDTPPIQYFSEKAESLLQDENTPFFKKEAIKKTRLEVLQLLAKDKFGQKSYDELINDEQIIYKISKVINMITPICERKEELYLDMRKDYLSTVDKDYLNKQARFKLIKDKYDIDFSDEKLNRAGGICYCRKDYAIIRMNCNSIKRGLDSSIIHEINHGVENCEGKCGWSGNKYLWLNETVNEFITQKITRIMHNNGHFIFTPKYYAIKERDIGNNAYQKLIILIEEFFNEFKEQILESRKNANIDVILSTIGKENFDALANLVTRYQNEFGEDYINLEKDLKLKQDSERVKKHYQLLEERDKILDAMRKYKVQNVNENKTI